MFEDFTNNKNCIIVLIYLVVFRGAHLMSFYKKKTIFGNNRDP